MTRYIILLVFCLALIGGSNAASTNDSAKSINEWNVSLTGIPDTRQSTEYSCAAASFQAVLAYYGRDIAEQDLMEMLNTDPEVGTYPDDVLRAAKAFGLDATFEQNLSIEDVEELLSQGIPIMVDCQSWRSVSEKDEPWAENFGNGHWMVIIGIDKDNVYFEDPYILGSRGFIPRTEFLERWHNMRGLYEGDTVKQIHMGIAIRGERPSNTTLSKYVA